MKHCWYILYFVLIFYTNILVSEANSWRCDYTYIKRAKGYFKYHNVPATWHDARVHCLDESAVIASPHPNEIHDALLDLMKDRNSSAPIFIGINARLGKGVYAAIDGTPLSKIPIKWMQNEPDNYLNQEDCLILTAEGFAADKNCDKPYPYFCYKEKKEDDNMFQGSCGTTDHAYEYSSETHSCYKFHVVPRTWPRAYAACSDEGGHLAIINSAQEAEVIKNIFVKNPDAKIIGHYRKDLAFIGLHDQDVEGHWNTIHGESLQEAGYDRYPPGEPNNNLQPRGQHCGCVFRTGLLCDYHCDELMPFICEKKPNSLVCVDEDEY